MTLSDTVALGSLPSVLDPSEQIAEVEDFVEFLRHRGQDRELARAAATASSPALEAIWNNPEDDVYDAV